MEGKLTKLNKQEKTCFIDENFFEIGGNVNPDFVKEGDVEYKVVDNKLVFIKVKQSGYNKPAYNNSNGSNRSYPPKQDDKSRMVSMAISYAKDLAVAGKIQVEEIADNTRKFMNLYDEFMNLYKELTKWEH